MCWVHSKATIEIGNANMEATSENLFSHLGSSFGMREW